MLFQPDRHEPLTAEPWNEDLARATIVAIVKDTRRAFAGEALWPLHPFDASPERPTTLKPIYYGAAGVIWALDHLAGAGAIAPGDDNAGQLPALLTAHRADSLRLAGHPVLGYPTGDAGILLLQFRLSPAQPVADELFRVIAANADHPARGFAWGGAGSALAALFMFEATGQPRWRELFIDVVEQLWAHWHYHEQSGCHLWMTDLYGARERRVMALHGFPGIVFPMLRGMDQLPSDRARTLVERTCRCIERTAIREGGFANWPLSVGEVAGPEALIPRVQHCIGAPGIVNSFATYLPRFPDIDELLLAAGELTWQAGPLVKMPTLCHGVPGSGLAFLKLFERTGDRQWLDRARRFAMHAIAQNQRFTRHYGVRKFSLWTGDLGLAVFLWRCIEGRGSFPTLDEF